MNISDGIKQYYEEIEIIQTSTGDRIKNSNGERFIKEHCSLDIFEYV